MSPVYILKNLINYFNFIFKDKLNTYIVNVNKVNIQFHYYMMLIITRTQHTLFNLFDILINNII